MAKRAVHIDHDNGQPSLCTKTTFDTLHSLWQKPIVTIDQLRVIQECN